MTGGRLEHPGSNSVKRARSVDFIGLELCGDRLSVVDKEEINQTYFYTLIRWTYSLAYGSGKGAVVLGERYENAWRSVDVFNTVVAIVPTYDTGGNSPFGTKTTLRGCSFARQFVQWGRWICPGPGVLRDDDS